MWEQEVEAWWALVARKLQQEWLRIWIPAWPLLRSSWKSLGLSFHVFQNGGTGTPTSPTYCDYQMWPWTWKRVHSSAPAQSSVQLPVTLLRNSWPRESSQGTVGWLARPPLRPSHHWCSSTNEKCLRQWRDLRMESKDPGSKPWSGIRHSFLTNGIHRHQNDLLASEQRGSHQDQNGVMYVNDLCYLEEASPMESSSTCFRGLAFWLQNDSGASETGCQFTHKAVRSARTALWILHSAQWLARGPYYLYSWGYDKKQWKFCMVM